MTGTIGVESITAETRPLLTDREYRATHAVVVRSAGRVLLLATGRDAARLGDAAAELARAHGVALADHDPGCCWACVPPLVVVRGCLVCAAGVVPAVARVAGRLVPYWVHRTTPEQIHAARVGA